MPFDYKKEYKEFYMPPKKPTIVTVPSMNYIGYSPILVDGRYSENHSKPTATLDRT